MPMLEGQIDAVIGVDTHRDSHAAALLDPNGGVRATLEVPSDRAGHARLLRLADKQAPGRRVWALEGTGCYGAGLTSFLVDHGEWVVEIDRPKRSRGRNGAKSDALDAVRAGREALAREQLVGLCQVGARVGPVRRSQRGAGWLQIGQAPAQHPSSTCNSSSSCYKLRPTPPVSGGAAAPGSRTRGRPTPRSRDGASPARSGLRSGPGRARP